MGVLQTTLTLKQKSDHGDNIEERKGYKMTYKEGCLYSLDDYWTGLLDWTTGLTFELTFERFSFQLL